MMKQETYYYQDKSGEVKGPLALESIAAAVAAGRLGSETILSADGGEPWMPASLILKNGWQALGIKAKRNEKAVKVKKRFSVAGMIEIMGWLGILVGVIYLGAFTVTLANGNVRAVEMTQPCVVGFVGGLLWLALGEILRRLTEIAEAEAVERG